MTFKFRFAGAALLVLVATPALALKLGRIEVKSALNQPLVAAIPVHPENLTELKGLSVGLAPTRDFKRAGLKLTPADRSLKFRVVSNDNGQTVILVTSDQPITAPYLDFLIRVKTRRGNQIREYVALLNPVTMAPVQPVLSAPRAAAPEGAGHQARQPPPVIPAHHAQAPAHPQARSSGHASGPIHVVHGDTLYGIASNLTRNTDITVNQMMLALKAANPDAFYKDNINDLSAGAILRMPTHARIGQISVATANAEVRRQYAAWRAAKPHPAKVLAGKTTGAATKSAPQPATHAPTSDHLALVAPTGKGSSASAHPGRGAGGTSAADLQQQLQNEHGTLISLKQSNADLESRVQSLKGIAGQSDKLLGLKTSTLADLQHKLAAVEAGKGLATSGSALVKTVGAGEGAAAAGSGVAKTTMAATTTATAGSIAANAKAAPIPVAAASASVSAQTRTGTATAGAATKAAAKSKPATHPAISGNAGHAAGQTTPHAAATHARKAGPQPWYMRPASWLVAALIVLVLILLGLAWRKRRPKAPAAMNGPLPDPDAAPAMVVAPPTDAAAAATAATRPDEGVLYARLKQHPEDLAAHLQLCQIYYERGDADRFVESAEAMHEELKFPECREWREVRTMGAALAPRHPLFAGVSMPADAPRESESWYRSTGAHSDADEPSAATEATAAGALGAGALAAGGLAAYEFESWAPKAAPSHDASEARPVPSGDPAIPSQTEHGMEAPGFEPWVEEAMGSNAAAGEAAMSDVTATGVSPPAVEGSEAAPPAIDYLGPLELEASPAETSATAADHHGLPPSPDSVGGSDAGSGVGNELTPLEFEPWPAEAQAPDREQDEPSPLRDDEPEAPSYPGDELQRSNVETQGPEADAATTGAPAMLPERVETGPAAPDTGEVTGAPPMAPDLASTQARVTSDPVNIKLELARAYLDMGDTVGAHALLHEVIEEGSPTQQNDARRLLAEAGASD